MWGLAIADHWSPLLSRLVTQSASQHWRLEVKQVTRLLWACARLNITPTSLLGTRAVGTMTRGRAPHKPLRKTSSLEDLPSHHALSFELQIMLSCCLTRSTLTVTASAQSSFALITRKQQYAFKADDGLQRIVWYAVLKQCDPISLINCLWSLAILRQVSVSAHFS